MAETRRRPSRRRSEPEAQAEGERRIHTLDSKVRTAAVGQLEVTLFGEVMRVENYLELGILFYVGLVILCLALLENFLSESAELLGELAFENFRES